MSQENVDRVREARSSLSPTAASWSSPGSAVRGGRVGFRWIWEWAQIISVRDGKMTRVDAFDDRAEALRTAGLSE